MSETKKEETERTPGFYVFSIASRINATQKEHLQSLIDNEELPKINCVADAVRATIYRSIFLEEIQEEVESLKEEFILKNSKMGERLKFLSNSNIKFIKSIHKQWWYRLFVGRELKLEHKKVIDTLESLV